MNIRKNHQVVTRHQNNSNLKMWADYGDYNESAPCDSNHDSAFHQDNMDLEMKVGE